MFGVMKTKGSKNLKINVNLGKVFRNLAEKAFLSFIILVFFALLFGVFIFFQYSQIIQKNPSSPTTEAIFNESLYQKIILEWQNREKKILEISSINFPNPFAGEIPQELTNQ